MKWIRHNNEITSYNYEIQFIIFHIFMEEFIALLKTKFCPVVYSRQKTVFAKYSFKYKVRVLVKVQGSVLYSRVKYGRQFLLLRAQLSVAL